MTQSVSSDGLMLEAEQETGRLLALAAAHYQLSLPEVEIRFDLSGQAAGIIQFSRGKPTVIRYNAVLLSENRDHFMKQTLAHEVAHLVTHLRYGSKIRPHGVEWKGVMDFFGAEPSRCHTFDTSHSVRRRQRRFNYHCGCQSHQLTTTRHRRVINGQTYLCRSCRKPLIR